MSKEKPENSLAPGEVIITSGTALTYISPGLEKLLGLSKDQYIHSGIDEIGNALHSLLENQETVSLQCADGQSRQLLHTCTTQNVSSGKQEIHFYQDLGQWHQLVQENVALKSENQELQLTEPVTGLMTARAIHLVLEPQVSRCRRYDTPLSIIKLQFQLADDQANPDESALRISRLLKDQLRWADMIGRTAASEFLVILPETDLEAAESITEKLDARIHEMDDRYQTRFGVTTWKKGFNTQDLLYLADAALYPESEKNSGKVA